MPGPDRSVHVTITGRVQGVGYRMWVENEALSRALTGWVRNRRDGSVEALFSGDAGAVERMLAVCQQGPAAAHVIGVAVNDAPPPASDGFMVLPTA